MKIKLFSHSDFDGLGCVILGKLVYRQELNYEICDYNNVNEKIKNFIISEEYKNYDFVYITDISVNEEVAELINNTTEIFQLLDHHATALNLNIYTWCKVEVENEKGKTCGTSLFYEELSNSIFDYEDLNRQNIKDFVETVRQYDTWEWKTKYNNEIPKQWNDLLYIIGRDEFISQMTYKLQMYDVFDFNDFESLMLKIEENKKQKYIESKSKEMVMKIIIIGIRAYLVGVVFAEQYISELGNILANGNTDLDFVAIISGAKTISFRGIKDYMNLGEIAKFYGGGGHPQSAGFTVDEEIKERIIDLIFK